MNTTKEDLRERVMGIVRQLNGGRMVEQSEWVDRAVVIVTDALAAEREKAAKDDVDAALAELREMFPDEEIGVDLRLVRGNAKGSYDAAEILLVHAEQYFDGPTIPEAMQKVREWAAIRAGDKPVHACGDPDCIVPHPAPHKRPPRAADKE